MSRYQLVKDNWGDFEREHYILLHSIDRLNDLVLSRYGSYAAAERALGYSNGDIRHRLNFYFKIPNVKGLKRLLKALDVSFQWAIFGGPMEPYRLEEITYKNLKKVYFNNYWLRKNPRVTNVITSAVAKRTGSVPLKYLVRIAREQNVSIDYLLE